ncbi:biotin-dependent carboxyltransferase family protein [Aquabacterium sp.]|uniref:5-oxoprolinase subunit C family protein n=1 Tax=Aquabacterium sp. TaxID=1872578 RepID=UPI002D1D1BE8|nr:biotin-dependent carboxyltransferase family protein [Aquabacterium sp.]HSW03867.1 biotin-dependent carboxyltransferase family protein [Aquabacterium sp.]
MIEILSATALATVQDLGREGALRWGVGSAGAMDPLALAAGNVLLGNDDNAAGIEVPVLPFQLRFGVDCTFAVTGADTSARLDEVPVLPWWLTPARAGQVLQLGLPQRGAWPASRAYVCVAGGIDVQAVLGSRSTQLRGAFGGHEGRALRQGDRLPLTTGCGQSDGNSGDIGSAGFGLVPPALALPLQVDGLPAMRVLPAAEYRRYTEASRAAFWAEPWKITAQSDRYGYRLAGTPLQAEAAIEMRSHGIVPGVIQVPPGGQPIVQMRDAQPSGGYPKIGTVIEADLWRLGQAPIGSHVRFIETSWDEAVAAQQANQRWLDRARRLVILQRTQLRKA